jgi:hypothetical protein
VSGGEELVGALAQRPTLISITPFVVYSTIIITTTTSIIIIIIIIVSSPPPPSSSSSSSLPVASRGHEVEVSGGEELVGALAQRPHPRELPHEDVNRLLHLLKGATSSPSPSPSAHHQGHH